METKEKGTGLFLSGIILISGIGALNWGLVAMWNFDLVFYLFCSSPIVMRSIYLTIGASGLALITLLLFNKIRLKAPYI